MRPLVAELTVASSPANVMQAVSPMAIVATTSPRNVNPSAQLKRLKALQPMDRVPAMDVDPSKRHRLVNVTRSALSLARAATTMRQPAPNMRHVKLMAVERIANSMFANAMLNVKSMAIAVQIFSSIAGRRWSKSKIQTLVLVPPVPSLVVASFFLASPVNAMQVAITIAIAAQTMMLPAVCPQEVWEDVPFWDASITARTMIANAIRTA